MEQPSKPVCKVILVFQPTELTILYLCSQDFTIILPGMYKCSESPFILITTNGFVETRSIMTKLFSGEYGFTCDELYFMCRKTSIEYWKDDVQLISGNLPQVVVPQVYYFWVEDLPNAPLSKDGSLFKFLSTCMDGEKESYSSSDEDSSDEELDTEGFQFEPPSFHVPTTRPEEQQQFQTTSYFQVPTTTRQEQPEQQFDQNNNNQHGQNNNLPFSFQ